jgi:xylulokinase
VLADVLHAELRPVQVRSPSAVGATLLAATAAGLPPPAIPLDAGEPIGPSARSAAYDPAFDRYVRLVHQIPAAAAVEPTVTPAASA